MASSRTGFRGILTRAVVVMAIFGIYGLAFAGASALLLGASSTSALARGGHGGGGFHGGGFHGGGFHGGGFRGGGFGFGWGPAFYPYGYYGYYPPYFGDVGVCYVVRQRVKTRHGWRIRRVSICE